ncbi:hypothetical protein V8B55DRAFT_1434513 [Mucor lusitanicus]|uniref:Uncharacterized protein n=2 Tax=Mucor circinelloides f. lusitanicus TaxID=29924 RepID=A0A162TI84_MUCCL|nr:hypothetical protein FB192DRAFT_1433749 [Mucor lusitanicus]OAD04782.1 hypothetical protein MUCCIDRAFT_79878 [Mucor lusitanicus CBS 277.49]
MDKFLDLQGCLAKHASANEFKKLVEVIQSSKSNTKEYKAAKKFADKITKDAYQILEQPSFVNYWTQKQKMVTRSRLYAAQRSQAVQQVKVYIEMLDEFGKSEHDESSDGNYSARESTPSSTSSLDENDTSNTYQYLAHNGDSDHYKLKPDGLRWSV